MEKVTKTKKAFAVVSKDTRELQMFGDGDLDSFAVHYSKEDAESVARNYGENAIVLPCTISYETLKS